MDMKSDGLAEPGFVPLVCFGPSSQNFSIYGHPSDIMVPFHEYLAASLYEN